jgi:transcription antitermination factor NusA-like protein
LKIIKELNEEKIPIIRIDNSLEKYIKMPIFQEKVDKANEMLRTVGLPKIATK